MPRSGLIMRLTIRLTMLTWALFIAAPAVARAQGAPPVTFRPYAHPVTLWVPPYAVARSQARLAASFGGAGAGDAITHLALQFWTPTPAGGVARVGDAGVTDGAVAALRDWGHAHGVRVLLCVYNGAETWDWPLARAAFKDHPEAFARNLTAEAARWGLDGVDVDLEGPGAFEADRGAFVSFVAALSRRLHAQKKHLTVDTFSLGWNAPNRGWWPALFPHVDALTTMGYEDSGLSAPGGRSYAAQKKAAGADAARLQIGMPSDKGQWRGSTALEQLQWVRQDAAMGVAIWDAQLPSPAWRTPPVWRTLRAIRGGR